MTAAADAVVGSESHADEPVPAAHRLPSELLRIIFNATGDWELCEAVGADHSLPVNPPFVDQATPLDKAILHSAFTLDPVREALSQGHRNFTQWGTRAMCRFSLIHLLDFFLQHDPGQLRWQCEILLPVVCSAWGRVSVLEWARSSLYALSPRKDIIAEAMDEASRHGQVAALDFWLNSGLELDYTELALENATVKCQIGVLEWWKLSALPLKIGEVLDFASIEGTTITLDWWAQSGLPVRYSTAALWHLSRDGNLALLDWWKDSRFPLKYDKQVLLVATKHGQVAVLSWWFESGLDLEYRFFDVEEALEDAIGEAEHARSQRWWEHKGYDVGMSSTLWTRPRNMRLEAGAGTKARRGSSVSYKQTGTARNSISDI